MSMYAQYMAVCAKFDTIFAKVSLHRCVRWFAPALPHPFTLSLLHRLQPRQAGMYLSDPRSPLIALCVPAFWSVRSDRQKSLLPLLLLLLAPNVPALCKIEIAITTT